MRCVRARAAPLLLRGHERRAARASRATRVLFMQPDVLPHPGLRCDRASSASPSPASARWRRSWCAREGPRPDQRLDAIDTAGMVVDRRRKNGLVGHGRPALAFDRPAEVFGADGAVALYRREALEDAAVDGRGLRRGPRDLGLRRRPRLAGAPARLALRLRAGAPWPTTCARYSPSTRAAMPEWDRMMQFRNRYLMIAKNDPLPSLPARPAADPRLRARWPCGLRAAPRAPPAARLRRGGPAAAAHAAQAPAAPGPPARRRRASVRAGTACLTV